MEHLKMHSADGVSENIGDALSDTNIITKKLLWNIFIHFHYKVKVFSLHSGPDHIRKIHHHGDHIIFHRNDLHLA